MGDSRIKGVWKLNWFSVILNVGDGGPMLGVGSPLPPSQKAGVKGEGGFLLLLLLLLPPASCLRCPGLFLLCDALCHVSLPWSQPTMD